MANGLELLKEQVYQAYYKKENLSDQQDKW
jgi:hypothetical protein